MGDFSCELCGTENNQSTEYVSWCDSCAGKYSDYNDDEEASYEKMRKSNSNYGTF